MATFQYWAGTIDWCYPSAQWARFVPTIVTQSWFDHHCARNLMRDLALAYSE